MSKSLSNAKPLLRRWAQDDIVFRELLSRRPESDEAVDLARDINRVAGFLITRHADALQTLLPANLERTISTQANQSGKSTNRFLQGNIQEAQAAQTEICRQIGLSFVVRHLLTDNFLSRLYVKEFV